MLTNRKIRPQPSTRYRLRERMLRQTEAYLTYQLRAADESRLQRIRRESWYAGRHRSKA